MKKIVLFAFGAALVSAPVSAFSQSMPPWKSYMQTGNVTDIVPSAGTSDSVAAWLAKKVDVTNGTATGLTRTGGTDTGTDISAALALSANATATRTVAAHFADTLNLADYGVVCDGSTDNATNLQAAFAAAATSSKYANGVKIVVPFGMCVSSVGVTLTATDGRSMGIFGGGMGASTLQFVAGGISATINELGSLSVADLHIQRSATAQGDVGLLVTGTSGGVDGTGQFDLSRVRVDGTTRAGSFQTGVHAFQVSVNASNLFTQLPDSAADTAPSELSSGLEISGTAGTDTTTQSDYLWSIDNKITNSTFQGGYNGVYVHGAVQGVFITNSESLGNTKAINWDGGGYNNFAELLFVSNFHGNAHICDVCTANQVSQITVTGSLLFHFNDGSAAWTGVSLSDGQQAEITGNTGNTSGNLGSETLISLNNFNFSSATGNTVVSLNGPIVAFSGTSSYDIATGNMGSLSSAYTGTAITGCFDPVSTGAHYLQCFNNLLNGTRDVYVDDAQSLHLHSAGSMYLDTDGTVNAGTFMSTSGSYDMSVGGNAYRALASTGLTQMSVCPDSSACTIGTSGGVVTFSGYPVIPSLTKAQILALSTATAGMIVNDSTDHVPVIYENGAWYPITLGTALSN